MRKRPSSVRQKRTFFTQPRRSNLGAKPKPGSVPGTADSSRRGKIGLSSKVRPAEAGRFFDHLVSEPGRQSQRQCNAGGNADLARESLSRRHGQSLARLMSNFTQIICGHGLNVVELTPCTMPALPLISSDMCQQREFPRCDNKDATGARHDRPGR